MIKFGIIGNGWRSEFYLRIAQACPDLFSISGVVGRSANKTAALAEMFHVPHFSSPEDLVRNGRPDFVVTSVAWDANPGLLDLLASLGMPTLSETPPATTVDEMAELCALTKNGAKIQVAEQYWLQPHHFARLAFAQSGKIGRVTQAQISVAHGYHGISLIRRFLGIGFENATIRAQSFKSPLVKGPGRAGPLPQEKIVESDQLIATFDFGDRLGLFDFTGDQYFAITRNPRILVRGERGEIAHDSAVYLKDYLTPIQVPFIRQNAGQHGNLAGHYVQGIQAGEEWLYHNPVAPARLFDDEIAIADCLLRMAKYAAGGEPSYSLEEACQDRYLDLAMQESLRENKPATTTTQPWAS
jgi:predicted dehydrogenase